MGIDFNQIFSRPSIPSKDDEFNLKRTDSLNNEEEPKSNFDRNSFRYSLLKNKISKKL